MEASLFPIIIRPNLQHLIRPMYIHSINHPNDTSIRIIQISSPEPEEHLLHDVLDDMIPVHQHHLLLLMTQPRCLIQQHVCLHRLVDGVFEQFPVGHAELFSGQSTVGESNLNASLTADCENNCSLVMIGQVETLQLVNRTSRNRAICK